MATPDEDAFTDAEIAKLIEEFEVSAIARRILEPTNRRERRKDTQRPQPHPNVGD